MTHRIVAWCDRTIDDLCFKRHLLDPVSWAAIWNEDKIQMLVALRRAVQIIKKN